MTLEEAVGVAVWLEGLTIYSDRAEVMPAAMSHQKASDVLERVRPAVATLHARIAELERERDDEIARTLRLTKRLGDALGELNDASAALERVRAVDRYYALLTVEGLEYSLGDDGPHMDAAEVLAAAQITTEARDA